MPIAVVFPGQGTQAPGMGLPWRAHPAWSVVGAAEDALGEPLEHLVLDTPAEELARTRAAQLGVLLTSLVIWDAARAVLPAPVAFAGHSLGQVTALVAAGVLDPAAGVRFAARRAELTQATADARPGRMAALLGADLPVAERACAGTDAWIANDNAPGQIVIAGTPAGVDAAVAAARDLGVRRSRALAVGGAFHTPLMDPAAPGLAEALAGVRLADPSAPVVSNGDGRPVSTGEPWRRALVEHVRVPVRWRETLETLEGLGAQTLVEAGPGGMIAGLAKRTVPGLSVVGIATPDDLDRLAMAVEGSA